MAIDRLALRARAERARARSRTVDLGLAWMERDAEIGGAMLAAALAYRLFLFALPLGFLGVALLGPLADALGTDPQELGADVGLAGLVTDEVSSTASGSSNWWVVLTALAALTYVAWVLYKALATVHALAWERSAASVELTLGAFAVFGSALVAQLVFLVGMATVRHHSPGGGVAALAVFLLGVAALWLAVSLVLPHSDARWSDLVPGAVLYAVGMLGVQVFTAYLLDRVLESKTSTYGALGTAAAILLGAFLLGRVAVAAATLNAALFERRT